VSGLTPNTTYYFQASATDNDGQTQQSAVIAVTTQPIPLPVWTLTGFAGTATQTSVTLTFATAQYATTGKVLWGSSANSLSNASAPEASPATSHSITVTGLSPNTTYYFEASATDDHSQTQVSNVIAITTLPVPLPVWSIANFAGTATETTATLAFATAQYATTGQILWGTSPDNLNQATPADASAVTSHSFTVAGLSPNTTYYFQASAKDDRGQTQASSVIAVTTQPIPPPVWSISGFAGTPGETTVALSFATSGAGTTGHVIWGTSASSLTNTTQADATPSTSHSYTVTGLSAGTTYFFQAIATDSFGLTETSAVISVTTSTALSWSIQGFDGTATANSVALIWQTGSVPTDAIVSVGLSPTNLTLQSISVPNFASTQAVNVTGLSPNTTYYFQVTATDHNGNARTSNVISKTTKASRPNRR
jgi:phosphodiesterase/alkaline phosphatase D-like protein